jgi:hypothetical protein
MYEAPRLTRFGTFRELTKSGVKNDIGFDILINNGNTLTSDGVPRS